MARVTVEGLSKRYRIGKVPDRYGRLTESIWETLRSPLKRIPSGRRIEYFWALRDVSLEVRGGEVVGIIGRNGAGKTTLLKILSRITEPTEGSARIDGRIGSLLEVGTGFHPELTGRENIFLNGAILGMRRAEIMRKFDEIVQFGGVEMFLDTPVKRYSSGMYVRLAFAVAAHLEPEVLIVDEVLSVGDAAFQKKCLGKMEDVAREGRTVIFVSHNLAAIERLCSQAYLLDDGRLIGNGPAHQLIQQYLNNGSSEARLPLAKLQRAGGDGKLRFVDLKATLTCGKAGSVELAYEAVGPLENVSISFAIFTLKGEAVAHLGSDFSGDHFEAIPDRGRFVCRFPRVSFLPGSYTVNIYCAANGIVADWVMGAGPVNVSEGDFFGSGKLPLPSHGSVALCHDWALQKPLKSST